MIVEGVNAVSHFGAQFNNCGPFPPIQQLRLHSRPEAVNHGSDITDTNSSKAEPEAVFVGVAGKRRELRAMVRVCDDAVEGFTC